MKQIKFLPQSGGFINIEYDTENYFAISQRGTTVPLCDVELIFVPKVKCDCGNAECFAQERHFSEEAIMYPTNLNPAFSASDEQDYAGGYSCYRHVQLYSKSEVLDLLLDGWLAAAAIYENGCWRVDQFLI